MDFMMKKTVILQLRVDEKTHDWLKASSKRQNRSVAKTIRACITQGEAEI